MYVMIKAPKDLYDLKYNVKFDGQTLKNNHESEKIYDSASDKNY